MSSKEYFNQVAGEWDIMRQGFFSEAVREKAYQVAEVKRGKTAADLGAGTGFITEGLLTRGLKVIAIDESESMLVVMKEKFAGNDCVQYLVGESKALPIPDGAVDYAFANMYLHHVEAPAAAILEMARIVKNGGRVIITDLDEHHFAFLKTEQHDRWLGFKRENIQRWLAEADLKNISVNCVGQNCCAQSSCGAEKAVISIFVALGEK